MENPPLLTYEPIEGLITLATSGTIRWHHGSNSAKTGEATSISQDNSQQFHGWNRMEMLV